MTSTRAKSLATAALLALQAGLMPSPASAADFRAEFPPQFTETPLGVNLQTGKFRYWPYSFAMGPFQLERGFNKSGFEFLGNTFVRTLQRPMGGGVNVRTVGLGGRLMDFYWIVAGGYYSQYSTTAIGWRLQNDNPGFTVVDRSGTVYKFTEYGSSSPPRARVTLITFADGSTISATYDSSDRLTYLESNRGYAVRYEYLNGGAQLKICGFNRAVTYSTATTSCSSSNYVVTVNNTVISSAQTGDYLRPNSVVDVAGLTSTLTYSGEEGPGPNSTPGHPSGLLQCMTLPGLSPGSSTCEFNNIYGPLPGQLTKPNQVRQQTDANGGVYDYEYDNGPTGDDPPKYPGGPPVLSSARVSGPGFSASGDYEDGLLKTLSAPGDGPSYFEYSGVELGKVAYVDGRSMTLIKDYLGNAWGIHEKPMSGSSDPVIIRTQTFPVATFWGNPTLCNAVSEKLCNKPLTQVDGRGNQTDYTYSAAHGGVLTMTLPAGDNGIRPQTRYEYAQRYAQVKNSSGTYVNASSPIWVKTRERFCKTTAASGQSCQGGAADEVITDFDYGPTSDAPNNLLLIGVAVTADGVTRRTCYGYDANGRKISETQPNANLASCPVSGGEPPPAEPCSGVSFSASSNAAVIEGTNSVFTVNKTGSTSSSCTVNYYTDDGTAVAPGDYTAKPTTALTFTSAQTAKTVSVTTADDAIVESAETFTLNLESPSDGSAIGTGTATATLNDNDSTPTCSGVSFTIASNAAVTEGTNSVFTITKTGSTSNSCSVNYATANGTATAGSDYTATSGTLTFTSAQTAKTVSVVTEDDTTVESAETLAMSLNSPTGGSTLGTPATATATINDNDSGGTPSLSINDAYGTEGGSLVFTVTKSGSTGSTVTVNYATANGTATSLDYTAVSGTLSFGPTETTKTIVVTTKQNTASEVPENFYVNLSGASGATISDGQGEGTIEDDDFQFMSEPPPPEEE